jgi:CheY-like chemotaxis protein
MDGRTFLHALRSGLGYIPVPVIVVTGEDIDSPGLRRLESLATAVLQKGVELETDLRQVLDRVLSGRRTPTGAVTA